MNQGILASTAQYGTMPRDLLGRPFPFAMPGEPNGWDIDAIAYLEKVERADGAALEQSVALAINRFIIGCKLDGIWDSIRCSCILAGARTIAGALTPLVGPTPTNINLVSGDYSRNTGLIGNGSTKRIVTNYANNLDPAANSHGFAWITSGVSVGGTIFGSDFRGGRFMYWTPGAGNTNGSNFELFAHCNGGEFQQFRNRFFGGWGVSRTDTNGFWLQYGSSPERLNAAAVAAPSSNIIQIFASRQTATINQFGNPRVMFYSFGRGLDLRLLTARVSRLRTEIVAGVTL